MDKTLNDYLEEQLKDPEFRAAYNTPVIAKKYKPIRSGKLRASKIQYPDGVGCCIWRPFPDGDEEAGITFDFTEEEIPDLIILLGKLVKAKAELYKEVANG